MHKILALPGDGIGHEVMNSALDVLNFLKTRDDLSIDISIESIGGASYDLNGTPISESVLAKAKDSDVVLFGAVGGPEWDSLEWENRPEHALLTLRTVSYTHLTLPTIYSV